MPESEYESAFQQDFQQERDETGFPYQSGPGDPFSYDPSSHITTRARIAVYDDLLSAPRIVDIEPAPVVRFIENIASRTYEFAQQQGGSLPYSVIREIAENFIHAQFKECTVSILDKGNTIRFSDQGPGIEKKLLVQQPGITSATAEMKRFIRGVGSGFPLVKEYLEYRNGFLSIDDNAHEGTVITLSVRVEAVTAVSGGQLPVDLATTTGRQVFDGVGAGKQSVGEHTLKNLDKRSIRALQLLYEKGVLGPSDLMEPLQTSASTAHRILIRLEQWGLVEPTSHRKRILSNAGLALLEAEGLREQGGTMS